MPFWTKNPYFWPLVIPWGCNEYFHHLDKRCKNLNLASFETPIWRKISVFGQNNKWGCFLTPKTPRGLTPRIFPGSNITVPDVHQCDLTFGWFSAKSNDGKNFYVPKSVKMAIFDPIWPPGDAMRIFIKNPGMLLFLCWVVVTSCKISEKSNVQSLRILRTNAKKCHFGLRTPIFDP